MRCLEQAADRNGESYSAAGVGMPGADIVDCRASVRDALQ
jgi:hypothetical protein